MHSFCDSAQEEIGSNSEDIFFIDFDKVTIDIEVNIRDSVLKDAQIKYLLLSKDSFSISRNNYLNLILPVDYKII
tara:strand:- start:890 stop:1114 length:225 start_codon:yes stop_codon:yes gene_type:complete